MDALELKLNEFGKALVTLKEALDQKESGDIFVRDATIQRFEYSFELCWKTVKEFLREKHGDMVFSPKEVFRSLGRNEQLVPERVELLLSMVEDRNETTHRYDEDFVDELYGRIESYYTEMRNLLALIST